MPGGVETTGSEPEGGPICRWGEFCLELAEPKSDQRGELAGRQLDSLLGRANHISPGRHRPQPTGKAEGSTSP